MATSNSPISTTNNDAAAYAELICNLIPFPMVMQAAIDLDLFEIIAAEERSGRRISAAEIADRLPAVSDKEQSTDKLERMLRLLASFEVLECSVEDGGRRVYGVAPVGKYFVRNEEGVSFGPFLRFHQDQVMLKSWTKLKDSVIEGGVPFIKAHGMNPYEHSNLDPRFNQAFNLGMFNQTTIVMKKILQQYTGFENLRQIVDVGGGIGHTLQAIVSKYPMLKAINFDLPHVIQQAQTFPGIEHVSGDMYESIPGPTDAIFMKWMLHGHSDERCVKLLKNCYDVLADNGKVIVVEHVVEEDEASSTSMAAKATLLFDILMMAQSASGRERTRQQFTFLANSAGFATVKFSCCVSNLWVIEFYK